MRKHLVPGSVAALLAATGLASAQQQPVPADTASVQSGGFSLTTGVDYSTGKYGGTSATDILYVPLTGAYEMDKWLFRCNRSVKAPDKRSFNVPVLLRLVCVARRSGRELCGCGLRPFRLDRRRRRTSRFGRHGRDAWDR